MVTHPKSIATVVVLFPLAGCTSSTPTEAVVISASVVSGEISEIAPTVVVFPTPKPPATMIFTGTGGALGRRSFGTRAVPTMRSGDGSKSTDHSHDGLGVGEIVRQHVYVQDAGRAEVTDEDAGDAEVHPQPRRDLGHRQRFRADADDGPHLRGEPHRPDARTYGDLGLQSDVGIGRGGAPG